MIEVLAERLIIRPIAARDADCFNQVLGDETVMEYSDDGALSSADVSVWVAKQIQDYSKFHNFGMWAIAIIEDHGAIGYISLTRRQDRTAKGESELGFRLARHQWGKGYATEAAQALVKYAFESTETQRVIAIVDPHNLSSVRVLEKLGMSFRRLVMFDGYDYPDKIYGLDKPVA